MGGGKPVQRVTAAALYCFLGACAPDLGIVGQDLQWTGAVNSATATIKNLGNQAAGPFDVYFTAEECPNSPNRRPQVHTRVSGLAQGAQTTLTANFRPLAHSDNANLGRVYSVSVRLDPKNEVAESNEKNNWDSRATQYNVSGLPVHTYTEALATILRGIEFDVTAAGELEIAPGYYKISEHRVPTAPSERVIALQVYKSYFESATGPSSPPRREDPFVFSIIDRYQYNASGYQYTGRDFHGHTFSFDVAFGPSCFTVSNVALNCTAPRLTVQTYTTTQLHTCGVMSEPPWTTPAWQ